MKTPDFIPNELNKNSLEESLDSKRIQYAEKVKLELEKHKDEIKDFSIFTSSLNANGFSNTGTLEAVEYRHDYEEKFEVYKVPKESNYFQEGKAGYVLYIPANWYTFVGPLGRTLHTPDRSGNLIGINIRGEKGKRLSKDIVDSVTKLLDTLVVYDRGEIQVDLKNISKQGLQVLKAFEGISEKFPSNGQISVKSMIEEYKQIIEKGE